MPADLAPHPVSTPFRPVAPNLAIWPRPDRAGFRPLFRHLIEAGHDGAQIAGPFPALILDDLLPHVPTALIGLRRALLCDVALLAGHYAIKVPEADLRIKLEIERTDRCRYFHADRVGTRLLTTYFGRGTEWLEDWAVERAALGRGGNDGVVRDPAGIRRLEPWSVGLFKGEAHPGLEGRGCVHRSPAVAHLHQARVLLTIDSLLDDQA
jgi:hypothetical protein